MQQIDNVPVTVLTDFFGAGKTTPLPIDRQSAEGAFGIHAV